MSETSYNQSLFTLFCVSICAFVLVKLVNRVLAALVSRGGIYLRLQEQRERERERERTNSRDREKERTHSVSRGGIYLRLQERRERERERERESKF